MAPCMLPFCQQQWLLIACFPAGLLCLQDLPGVEVTLIHSAPRLLPTLPARLGAAAESWLKGRGCKVGHMMIQTLTMSLLQWLAQLYHKAIYFKLIVAEEQRMPCRAAGWLNHTAYAWATFSFLPVNYHMLAWPAASLAHLAHPTHLRCVEKATWQVRRPPVLLNSTCCNGWLTCVLWECRHAACPAGPVL